MRKEERSRSPVSVHQWVAALPDITKDTESEERGEERDQDVDDDDNLTLGAEGESLLGSLLSSSYYLQPEDITVEELRMLAS